MGYQIRNNSNADETFIPGEHIALGAMPTAAASGQRHENRLPGAATGCLANGDAPFKHAECNKKVFPGRERSGTCQDGHLSGKNVFLRERIGLPIIGKRQPFDGIHFAPEVSIICTDKTIGPADRLGA